MLRPLTPATLAALVLLSACWPGEPLRHPSDAQLIANFRAHRMEFETLRAMFQADRALGRVGDGFTRPEDPTSAGVSSERIAEYHRLFDRLGLRDGIEGYDRKEQIWFHASSKGLAISGSAKGYLWMEGYPDDLVEDTDAYRPESPRSFTVHRKIEGSWYIEYDSED